jgi:FkbM family methyltransferase
MMAELVGPNGSVLSIEPILYTFGILKYMVRKLHLKNVTIMNVAVSEHDGIVSMVVPMNELGEPNLYESRVIGSEIVDQPHVVSIEARSIDSLFPGERKLSFIKCDAEGHELKCVLGARGVIRKWKPAWMIEIWGAPGNKTEPGFKTVELMRGEGYQTFWFDGGRLRKLAQDSQSVNGNYFFLHRCHLDHLIVAGLVEN